MVLTQWCYQMVQMLELRRDNPALANAMSTQRDQPSTAARESHHVESLQSQQAFLAIRLGAAAVTRASSQSSLASTRTNGFVAHTSACYLMFP